MDKCLDLCNYSDREICDIVLKKIERMDIRKKDELLHCVAMLNTIGMFQTSKMLKNYMSLF